MKSINLVPPHYILWSASIITILAESFVIKNVYGDIRDTHFWLHKIYYMYKSFKAVLNCFLKLDAQ